MIQLSPNHYRIANFTLCGGNDMIARVWHGWTTPANADVYEATLKEEIFVGIQRRRIAGYMGIQLFRRDIAGEVEFVTIMRFESLDAVREFAGDDYEAAVVPPKARALLSRYDATCTGALSPERLFTTAARRGRRSPPIGLSRPSFPSCRAFSPQWRQTGRRRRARSGFSSSPRSCAWRRRSTLRSR
jgi:heme-degrading monooxygenase HmoA